MIQAPVPGGIVRIGDGTVKGRATAKAAPPMAAAAHLPIMLGPCIPKQNVSHVQILPRVRAQVRGDIF